MQAGERSSRVSRTSREDLRGTEVHKSLTQPAGVLHRSGSAIESRDALLEFLNRSLEVELQVSLTPLFEK